MRHIFGLFLVLICFFKQIVGKFVGWIDPDTKIDHKKLRSFRKDIEYDLVMSDEFEKEGRLFADGDDPMWCAIEKSDDDQTAQGKKSLQVSEKITVHLLFDLTINFLIFTYIHPNRIVL